MLLSQDHRGEVEIGMKWEALEEEACSVARTIGVIGDRWTLLILRECFLRTRRFEGFQSALGITRLGDDNCLQGAGPVGGRRRRRDSHRGRPAAAGVRRRPAAQLAEPVEAHDRRT